MRRPATFLLLAALAAAPAAAATPPATAENGPPTPESPNAGAPSTEAPNAEAPNAEIEAHNAAEPAGEHPSDGTGAADQPSGEHGSRLTDERIPLDPDAVPERPRPLVELGNPFLGSGTLEKGIVLPTGAVWQPSLLVFGTLRTAYQSFDNDAGRYSELVGRLDLFGNLQLSGTERLIAGFRPLDRDGRFTSYVLSSDLPGAEEDEAVDELNGELTSLFFEGDFGEIFPNLSRDDFTPTDIGFSVGRQPLLFQEGLLINDSIDGIGLTRNTLQPHGTSNFRATLFWGWNEIGRNATTGSGIANREDGGAQLYGLLTSTDLLRSTVDADLVWVRSKVRGGDGGPETATGGDLAAGGISFVQRIGKAATSFRVLGSYALDDTAETADGLLLFSEASWSPPYGHDHLYVNGFWAMDEFVSAARGPATGGPLGRAGINFAAVGLGRYGAALSSRARDVAGGALGYQRFFDHTRKQLLVELGARIGTADEVSDSVATTVRYQAALGRRFVVVVDGFVGRRQAAAADGDDQTISGSRVELVVKF